MSPYYDDWQYTEEAATSPLCTLSPEALSRALAAVMVTDSPDNREALRRPLLGLVA